MATAIRIGENSRIIAPAKRMSKRRRSTACQRGSLATRTSGCSWVSPCASIAEATTSRREHLRRQRGRMKNVGLNKAKKFFPGPRKSGPSHALLIRWHPGSSQSSVPALRSCRRRRCRSPTRAASRRSWFTRASTTTRGCPTCRSPTCACRCPSSTSVSARYHWRRASRSPQERIARVIETKQPDAVLVRGDTSATIAGARAAVAAGVPLLHVEAGLRSYRQDMPEEHNRIETDQLSDLLFAPCDHARDVLLEEGVAGHGPCDRRRPRRRPARDREPPARGRRGGRVRPRHRPPQLQHRLARAARCRA